MILRAKQEYGSPRAGADPHVRHQGDLLMLWTSASLLLVSVVHRTLPMCLWTSLKHLTAHEGHLQDEAANRTVFDVVNFPSERTFKPGGNTGGLVREASGGTVVSHPCLVLY